MHLTISNPIRVAAAFTLALLTAGAAAQKYTPDPPPLTLGPCQPTKKNPCPSPPTAAPTPSTDPFPFPGEPGQPAPAQPPATSTTPAPGAFPFPGEPATPAAAPGSFPFPGEPSAPAAPANSSSSSSSDQATDPDQSPLKDEGSTGSTRFSRKRLPKVTVVDPDDREAEDLQVSHYYLTTGNYQGSYLRAKDAVTTIPDDPAAHLALAEVALHLNKSEEAAAEYNATLKLGPSDEQVKAVHKGLAELASAKPPKPPAK